MILRQFLHANPVGLSYLFGCGGKASAAVVDPVGDVAPYLQAAQDTGMRILYVVDTHIHADHVSAGRRLADAAGAEYVLFAGVEASPEFHGVRDGDVLPLGNVTAEVLHVPGHTPEHICLLVTDRTRAPEPWFVLTGHTLMVGDVGRTELVSAVQDGARDLFRSLRRLKALPEYVEILPGAFAGSVCGRVASAAGRCLPSASRSGTMRLSGSTTKRTSSAPCRRTSRRRRWGRPSFARRTPDSPRRRRPRGGRSPRRCLALRLPRVLRREHGSEEI